jgi:hypothetical protein
VAGRIEARCEFEASLEQILRVIVQAQTPGDFRQHSQSRHIRGVRPKVSTQACISDRKIVLDQRGRRFHQPRILGRRLEVMRPGLVGRPSVTLRIEAIGEQPPTIGRTRLQLCRSAKGRDCFGSPAGFAARDPELEVHRCGMRLLARERLEYLERQLSLTADAVGGPENQARTRMTRNGLEDLTRLLGGKRSIPLQQSGGMPQRNLQCPNGF